MEKDPSTEQRILKAAKKVFHQKGLAGARMEEIAREGGINKALLHYYFRTKQKLFEQVFLDAFSEVFPKVIRIIGSEIPFEEKIRAVSAFYHELLTENPHLPIFVLNAIQQDAEKFSQTIIEDNPMKPAGLMETVMRQIQEEVNQGNIKPVDPRQVMINLVSMSVFPFMMKPLMTRLLGMSEADFDAFIQERKTFIPEFMMNALKP